MSRRSKIIAGIIGVIVLIQLIPVDRSTPQTDPESHLFSIHVPSDEVHHILKSSCMDCHSYETRYPWYSYVAPLSWWLQNHINNAREELNFSVWATYDQDKKDHMLKEAAELIQEGKMPLTSYTLVHRQADLGKQEKQLLISWFNSLRKTSGSGENFKNDSIPNTEYRNPDKEEDEEHDHED